MFSDLQALLGQWLRLAAAVSQVLGLGLLAGWAITLSWLPLRFAFRWILVTPIVGLAVLSVIGLPLSLIGLPVKVFFPVVAAALTLLAAWCTFGALRHHPLLRRGRIMFYIRARGGRLLLLFVIITSLSAYLMTHRYRTDIRDYWGSGDFAPYWGVAEYLLHHGGAPEDYAAQNEFRSPDLNDHLTFHARLGCMVYLSQIAAAFDAENVHRAVNSTLTSLMCLLVGIGAVWLDSVRCRAIWPLVVVACHPFLYFLLYFSYLSQATGVLLTVAGFLIARESISDGQSRHRTRVSALAGGLFLGAALLQHPTMPPVIAVIFGSFLVYVVKYNAASKRWEALSLLTVATLAVTCYYLPACWREASSLGTKLAGWNWQRLIGFNEIAGVSSVLGYDKPGSMSAPRWVIEVAFGSLLLTGLWVGWRTRQDRLLVAVLGGTTLALAAATLWKVAQHVPNATHSYVKALSLFIIILLLACLAPLAKYLNSLPKNRGLLALGLLLAAWLPLELLTVRSGRFQSPRFREPLVALARRQIAQGSHLSLDVGWDLQTIAPIVRHVRWLDLDNVPPGSAVTIVAAPPQSGTVIDRAGPYFAVRNFP